MMRRVILVLGVFIIALAAGVVAGQRWLFPSGVATLESSAKIAADSTPPATQFEGFLSSNDNTVPGVWLVDVYPVAVLTDTRVFTNGLEAVPGTWARVEALKLEDAGLQATAIELQLSPRSDLLDRIQAMDGNSLWQVGATQVLITSNTTITGTGKTGDLALVRGKRTVQGIEAYAIQVMAADLEIALAGEIEAIDGNVWQVAGKTVLIDSYTQIGGQPAIGREAQVLGVEHELGQVLAMRIWVVDKSLERQLFGWLVSHHNPTLWTVYLLGQPQPELAYLVIGEDTTIDDSQAPIEYGAWLDIAALQETDTVYQATAIGVLQYPLKERFVGLVESRPSDGGLLGKWQLSGYQVSVEESTAVVGMPDVGLYVEVVGAPDHANLLHAEVFKVVE